MKTERRIFDVALILTFILSLFVPLLLTNMREESVIEKRKLAPFPVWKFDRKSIAAFPGAFQTFFDDHFGLRDELAQCYYFLGAMLKNASNPNVLIGEEGWLFYIKPDDGNSLEDYRKIIALSEEQLFRWKRSLEFKHEWLRQRGIRYLFVIAPDKHSIYGKCMPRRIWQIGTQSCLDQFLDYMRGSDVPILDLRPALMQAKSAGQLYFKTDAHWNAFGASVAQEAIMTAVSAYFPEIRVTHYVSGDFLWEAGGTRPDDFFWSAGGRAGDLARMLNLSDLLQEEQYPRLRDPLPVCEKYYASEPPVISTTFWTVCPQNAPSAVIFRDSYGTILQPYLSPYFSKSLYIWQRPTMQMFQTAVAQFAPDIVIEERVERYIQFIPEAF